MTKRFISFMLVICLLFSVGTVPSFAETESCEVNHGDSSTYKIQTKEELVNFLVTSGGSAYLDENIQLNAGELVTITKSVNLCLNGKILDLNGGHIILQQGSGQWSSPPVVKIYDCQGNGKIANGHAEYGGAFYIKDYSKLELHAGTIYNCTADIGGAVCLDGSGDYCLFTLDNASIVSCSALRGAAVDVEDGAVIIQNHSEITSCTAIYDSAANAFDKGKGSAVYVSSSGSDNKITMLGGTISGNVAQDCGCIYINKGYKSYFYSSNNVPCIVDGNYAYSCADNQGNIEADWRHESNTYPAAPFRIGALATGSSIGIDYVNDQNFTSGVSYSDNVASALKSDDVANYIVYSQEDYAFQLASRILTEPSIENDFTVELYTEDLDENPQYQWYYIDDPSDVPISGETNAKLSDTAILSSHLVYCEIKYDDSGYGYGYSEKITLMNNKSDLSNLFYYGGTGYLNSDFSIDENLTVSADCKLYLGSHVLNLNGHGIDLDYRKTLDLYGESGKIINGFGSDRGGAFLIEENAVFNMYGGTIENCNCSGSNNCGGAVYIGDDGIFNMYGGLITSCSALRGGGVDCSEGQFHMYGGLISSCSAENGGGVYCGESASSLHMHGGTITGNTASQFGGGIYNKDTNSSFDGKCIVKDNIGGDLYTETTFRIREKYEDIFSSESTIVVVPSDYILNNTEDRIFATNAEETDVDGFISGIDAYYVAYYDFEQSLQMVSRICEQPRISNNYYIGITTGGIDHPENITYQWKYEGGNDITGETLNHLQNPDLVSGQAVFCKVTFPDGSYVNSNKVRVPDAETHWHYNKYLDEDIYFDTKITNEEELRNFLITLGGIGYLANDITLTTGIAVKMDASLCLGGNTLDLNGYNISVNTWQCVLNIYDCESGTGTIINGRGDIGGAFCISDAYLNMYGGTIYNCVASFGGAFASSNGDMYVAFYDSSIVSCSALIGGAVYAAEGSFHSFNSTIASCTAISDGYYYHLGTKAQSTTAENEFYISSGLGGAVFNIHSEKSFHMHGGTISGNTAGLLGGGIYSTTDLSFDGKCIVKDNFSYGGKAVTNENKVRDNIYTTIRFEIGNSYGEEGLSDGSELWVTESPSLLSSGAIFAGKLGNYEQSYYYNLIKPVQYRIYSNNEVDYGYAKPGDVAYFHSDVDGYSVAYTSYDGGCLYLTTSAVKTVSFDSLGGTTYASVSVLEGTIIDLTEYVPTRDAQSTFNGWYEEGVKLGNTYTVTQDVILTARWIVDQTDAEDGSKVDTVYNEGDTWTKVLVSGNSGVQASGLEVIATSEKAVATDKSIKLVLTAEDVNEASVPAIEVTAIKTSAGSVTIKLIDIDLTKYTYTSSLYSQEITHSSIHDTGMDNIVEVLIPFDVSGKENIQVYHYHDGGVKAFVQNNTGEDGTFYIENNTIHLFTTKFSTYAIGYTLPATPVVVSSSVSTPKQSKDCPQDSTCVYAKFTDADPKEWYHSGVHYCVEKAYMNGIADTLFAPEGTLSRGMVVTMLWRLKGKPVVDYSMSFKDVPEDEWYTEAIRWGQSTGVVLGYNDNEYAPEKAVSREELAAILYRYEKNINNGGFTGTWMYQLPCSDSADIESWAYEAVCWCNMKSIVNGYPDGSFKPAETASRAEAANMMQRFCEDSVK